MQRIMSLLVALLLVTSAVTPVAAQDSDDDSESILNSVIEAESGDRLDAILGAASGFYARAQNMFQARADDQTPAEHAADTKQVFNDNNETLLTYVNDRSTASTDADVVALRFTEEDETSETIYLVADVNNSTYQSAQMVNSTDRTVDEECTLEDSATRNADEELDTFVTEFATGNENTTSRYRSRMVTEYSGKVSCTFIG